MHQIAIQIIQLDRIEATIQKAVDSTNPAKMRRKMSMIDLPNQPSTHCLIFREM